MSIDIDKERQAFEVWRENFHSPDDSGYSAFDIWLAAKRHAAQVAEPSGASVEGDARDAMRLMFAMQDIDGFGSLKLDKHDYAIRCMAEAGRDEPTAEDELNGVRRLIDAAMSPNKEG